MPARLPMMSQQAMSTPLMALPSTGPFRQYELTNIDWNRSSTCSGSLPITNGFRYLSTAVSTARARCVKVAHPRPYSPGSLVSTLTTTRRIPAGAVRIVFTSVILSGGNFRPSLTGCCAEPVRLAHSHGKPRAPAPTVDRFSHWRLFIVSLLQQSLVVDHLRQQLNADSCQMKLSS